LRTLTVRSIRSPGHRVGDPAASAKLSPKSIVVSIAESPRFMIWIPVRVRLLLVWTSGRSAFAVAYSGFTAGMAEAPAPAWLMMATTGVSASRYAPPTYRQPCPVRLNCWSK
jgi:hypothetical protein